MVKLGKKILIGALLAGMIPLAACTYSNIQDDTEREFEVADFNRIYVQGNFTIKLEQGTEHGVKVKGMKESVQTVEAKTDSITQTLEISRDKFSMSSPELIIRCKQLDGIRIEGGATVDSEGYLDVDKIDIRVEGGAKINLKLKANSVKLRGEGGVVFDLEGFTRKMESDLFGMSYLKARNLETDTTLINVEGISVATIRVNKYLKARMQGIGKINYIGDPELEQSVEGLTKISQE